MMKQQKTYKHFCVETEVSPLSDKSIVTVTLDVQGRPMNVLTAEVMHELDAIVEAIEHSHGVELVIFTSGKESGFLAGADVSVIAGIQSREEAVGLIDGGQRLFARIENLAMPTLAILHGPCLGGGLEWALACDHRVVRADASAKMGLPEIKLGLIPGWGGTQRLPRIVGVSNALSMILLGKHLDAHQAVKCGLVDEAIHPDRWSLRMEEIKQGSCQAFSSERLSIGGRLKARAMGIARPIILGLAIRKVRGKSKHYPALASAIRAIRAGFDPATDGFVVERNEFVDLLSTSTSKHLLNLFFARERARKVATWMREDEVDATAQSLHRTIRNVGVLGAGAMGAGIAGLAAVRGFHVIIKEMNKESLEAGRKQTLRLINQYADRKQLSDQHRTQIIDRLAYTIDANLLASCDLVVEAVVERMDVKKKVFAELDNIVKPEAILVSNTSSLSVTEMAQTTRYPHRIAGLHFFNPVHRMELVEVIRAGQTNGATVATLLGFVKALGKTPVVTKDSPGFLVNRILFPYLGEAILMVAEGYEPEKIDKEIRKFGMPMGPLELLDQVGLDVARHVAVSLEKILPDAKRVADFLDVMIDQGRIGKKSSIGFYRYRKGKKHVAVALERSAPLECPTNFESVDDDPVSVSELIATRLVTSMLAETIRCQEEAVVDHDWAIDLAMVLGTGFAPHTGGPTSVIKETGISQLYRTLRTLEARLGKRFAVPDSVIERMLPTELNNSEEIYHES